MNTYTIEIHPKKAEFDPLGAHIKTELIEAGEPAPSAAVQTRRLYRIQGNFSLDDIKKVAETLLVDPVVETAEVEDNDPKTAKSKKVKKEKPGWILDVWPKPGVTDPVGETVEKGLRDLGYFGEAKATSAQRYVFPKITEPKKLKILAKRVLANELIHDIDLHKPN